MDADLGPVSVTTDLRPYVPRGALEWVRDDPSARYREVDGSLVFVDISGFTAMSERLARLGRVGAEEVTDLLNHTFSRLLAVAYEDGGSLLKFGGDALLVEFDGPQHCHRAVHAAAGMRRKLRALQPLRSSAGQVRLRMSVGVHTAPVDHFLVGSGHRELLVAGPAASETVRMEGLASAGEIMVSDAVVRELGAAIAVTARDGGYLLRRAPEAPRIAGLATTSADPDLARGLVSHQVRARLEAGAPQAEHRPAVVAFVKITGIDELLATQGAAATASALEEIVDAIGEAAAPDDVCVLASDVDAGAAKVILTAGVPTAQEFDGERMLRTLGRLRERSLALPWKAGVHHGPVFAGVVGPPFRLTYTIIGDAVNLAARVMARAAVGEILATPEVLNRSHALFDVTELEPFEAKGKRHPVVAYRVGPVVGTRARRARARFPLAGRRAELAALLDEATTAWERGGRLVQLSGPAGIGKSRLIDELQERRPEAPMVTTGCSRYESTTPYYSAGRLVRAVLGLDHRPDPLELRLEVLDRAPDLESALPLLGDVLGVPVPDNDATRDLTAGFRAERTAAAVCRVLEAALPEPATIVVEDVHWVDPESWNVVVALTGSTLARRRWLLLTTSRHPLLLDRAGGVPERHLPLQPLTEDDARDLVYAAVEQGFVTMARAQALLERAGGNPFFLEELLRVGDSEDLPDSVDALVQTQLDQLPAADRDLLSSAAVLGIEIDVGLLEAAAGIPAADQQAEFVRLSDFVDRVGPGAFRFRHALVQDAAYSRLPFRRRQQLHRRAAEALERRRAVDHRPDLLALHTYHARDWERARAYAIEAAELASERFANLTAAEQYRHAIESGRYARDLAAEEVASTWERMGEALLRASAYDEAVTAYRQAKRLAVPSRHAHLCGQIGQLRERQSRYGDALRWYTRALAASDGGDQAARILVETAIVRARQAKPDLARVLLDRADAHADLPATRARIAYVRAWCAMLLGEDGDAHERRALRLFEEAEDLIGQGLAFNIMSMSAYYRGDWDDAASAYEQAALLRRRVGDEVAVAVALGNLGELFADQGHFERARPLLEECRTVCAAAGFPSSRHFATMTLGRLDARVGRFESASAQIVEALEALEAINMPWLVFDARRYLAELAVFQRDVEQALHLADRVDETARLGAASFRLVGQRLRACAWLVAGDAARAREHATDLLTELDPSARDYETALTLQAIAVAFRTAGDPRAVALADRAAAALGRLGVVVPGERLVLGPGWSAADVTTPALGGHTLVLRPVEVPVTM